MSRSSPQVPSPFGCLKVRTQRPVSISPTFAILSTLAFGPAWMARRTRANASGSRQVSAFSDVLMMVRISSMGMGGRRLVRLRSMNLLHLTVMRSMTLLPLYRHTVCMADRLWVRPLSLTFPRPPCLITYRGTDMGLH